MLALVVVLTPLELKLQLTTLIASVAGFSAVLHVLSDGSSAARRVRELFAEHTQLASHEDKLGMLALIGDDVRSLLLAWVKPRDASKLVPWGKLWMPAAAIVLAGAVWCMGLAGAFAPGWPEFFPRIVPAEWLGLLPASPGATPGDWVVFIAWLLFAIVLFVAPWLPITKASSRPDRVLLIVDDLDRCQPEEMLSVIEGLKLLLDIPEVAERLQISMLVDEDVLGHAISRRYHAKINERVEAMSADLPSSDPARRLLVERNIIAEQTEKLFACSLRIGALKAAQLGSLIAKLAGREFDAIRDEADGSEGLKRTMESEMNPSSTEGDRPAAAGPVKSEEPEDNRERDDGGTDSEGGSSTEEEAPHLSTADVRFTSSEILTLQQRVPQYFAAVGRLPSPRAVRMLTFKIQLCRFLLQQRSTDSADWSVDAILDALTAAQRDFDEKENRAVTIARQVI